MRRLRLSKVERPPGLGRLREEPGAGRDVFCSGYIIGVVSSVLVTRTALAVELGEVGCQVWWPIHRGAFAMSEIEDGWEDALRVVGERLRFPTRDDNAVMIGPPGDLW